MRLTMTILIGWLTLGWTSPALAQQKAPPSPAELLPANTIAFAELHKPGLLAKNIRALFKGSVLFNAPDSLADRFAKHAELYGGHGPSTPLQILEAMGLAISPEVVNELSKTQGAAAAFLGMKPDADGHDHPEYLFIVQPGSSNAPRFMMRALLSLAPVKPKETVHGVHIYRVYAPHYVPGQSAVVMQEQDPAFAMTGDAVFIGSYQAVKHVIERVKGNAARQSLAQDADFQAAQKKVGGEPGLFVFARPAAVLETVKHLGNKGDARMTPALEGIARLINPKAIRAYALGLGLENGTLHYRDVVLLDPREKSPLLEIIPSTAAHTDLLHFAPRDAIAAVVLSNGEGTQRWHKLVKTLDDVLPAQALGGARASEQIQGLEQQLGVSLGDALGKVKTIGFAVGNPLKAPFVVTRTEGPNTVSESGGPQVPMVLLLETADAKAAQDTAGLVVKIAQMAAGNEVKPQAKKVQGQDLHTITINAHYSVAYGVTGNTVVVGPYAEGVAQALADGAAKTGLAADAKVMAQVAEFKSPIAVAIVKPGSFVFSWFALARYSTRSSAPEVQAVPAEKGASEEKKTPPPPEKRAPKTTTTVEKESPEAARIKKQIGDLLDQEPVFIVGVMRGEDFLLREGKASGWEQFLPRVVNFAAEMMAEHGRRQPGSLKPVP